ncbi:MAG: class I SAM-dependent methyltransferase [Chloroflexota bacterium]|nr:class I SAM-dependent methyltransferase [Chloroflexota bacterium]
MDTGRPLDRLASPYDLFMAPLEWLFLRPRRKQWLPCVRGDVLEIGVGTGANLPFYAAGCCRLIAVDVSREMLNQAAHRAQNHGVRLAQIDVQHLTFPESSFDWVVGSLLFCGVANPLQGLKEICRVLRPDGRLLLIEHVRSTWPLVGVALDVANVFWNNFTHYCNLNRRTVDVVQAAGFVLRRVEAHQMGVVQVILAEKAVGKA